MIFKIYTLYSKLTESVFLAKTIFGIALLSSDMFISRLLNTVICTCEMFSKHTVKSSEWTCMQWLTCGECEMLWWVPGKTQDNSNKTLSTLYSVLNSLWGLLGVNQKNMQGQLLRNSKATKVGKTQEYYLPDIYLFRSNLGRSHNVIVSE